VYWLARSLSCQHWL